MGTPLYHFSTIKFRALFRLFQKKKIKDRKLVIYLGKIIQFNDEPDR